jgi:hypothetical protein
VFYHLPFIMVLTCQGGLRVHLFEEKLMQQKSHAVVSLCCRISQFTHRDQEMTGFTSTAVFVLSTYHATIKKQER